MAQSFEEEISSLLFSEITTDTYSFWKEAKVLLYLEEQGTTLMVMKFNQPAINQTFSVKVNNLRQMTS